MRLASHSPGGHISWTSEGVLSAPDEDIRFFCPAHGGKPSLTVSCSRQRLLISMQDRNFARPYCMRSGHLDGELMLLVETAQLEGEIEKEVPRTETSAKDLKGAPPS